jgi:hypothetical protein
MPCFQDDRLASRIFFCYRRVFLSQEGYELTNELISTPNADWCPLLRSFADPVHIRGDGTFGEDDPTCWPQFYDPNLPYLACIPLNDRDPTSAVHVFRRGLLRDHVKISNGVGKITWCNGILIKTSVLKLVAEATALLSEADKEHGQLQILVDVLSQAVERLVGESEVFSELRILFGLTGRLCLEVKGYVDYHTKFLTKPRTKRVPRADENVVGVLVRDRSVCADYARMGVPVWYIRDGSLVPNWSLSCFVQPTAYYDRPLAGADWFRDDAYFRRLASLFPPCSEDTYKLLEGIYGWTDDLLRLVRSKLSSLNSLTVPQMQGGGCGQRAIGRRDRRICRTQRREQER